MRIKRIFLKSDDKVLEVLSKVPPELHPYATFDWEYDGWDEYAEWFIEYPEEVPNE